MYNFNKLFLILSGMVFCLIPDYSKASCDCGSTNQEAPCTGQSIKIDVTAKTPNGGTAVDSQYNWSFNSGGGDARCGQFANGDYWVAPAPGKDSVTITSITGSGSITADVNPHPGSYGLLNGTKSYSGYNASENIIPTLPQSYSAETSLVAAIQRNEAVEGACGTSSILGECVDSYNVVTVLPSVPANAGSDTLRPNITGATKELLTFSDLDLSRIPAESFLTGTDAAGLEDIRRRWSHSMEIFSVSWSTDGGATWKSNGEAGRGLRSHILIDDYAAGTSTALHSDLATLFSADNQLDSKKKSIAAILSYGLDLYHAVLGPDKVYPVRWASGAGQHAGKFTPVVLLAALEKNNPTRLGAVKAIAGKDNSEQPQELAQLHVGPNGPVWGDDEGITRYWNDMKWAGCYDTSTSTCNIGVGKRTAADPYKYIDGPANAPGSNYFSIGYGGILNFAAMMHLMPEFMAAVNTTKPLDFVNRARTHGLKTLPDPVVTIDSREFGNECDVYRGGAGCGYYYPTASIEKTWGPKNLTDASQGAVTTVTPGYTQQGRFASMDGEQAPISLSYVSRQLHDNWATLINSGSYAPILPTAEGIPAPQSFRLE